MSVKDARTAPFIWASIAALNHLRASWSEEAGVRMQVGRSVYYALCELANEDHARSQVHENSGRFKTSRKRICKQAGPSDKPVDKALRELERIGLLRVERGESTGTRPGSISSYTLLEPESSTSGATPDTCGDSPHVEGEQGMEMVRTSSGVAPDVGTEKVRTSPYRGKEVKEEGRSEALPPTLPAPLLAPLQQVADAKDGAVDQAAIRRACETYRDRDVVEEAEKFCAWHLHGNGRSAGIKNLALGFRNWLKGAAPSNDAGGIATLTAPATAPEPIVETEKATATWSSAKQILERNLPGSTFSNWIAPLEAAGERGQSLVLLDTSDHGAGSWAIRKYRALIMEVLEGFDGVEIVDLTQLELEAG